MKAILALCAAVLVAGGYLLYDHMKMPSKYGAFVGAKPAAVADVIARPKDFLKTDIALEGVVREQCTTMGCYFFFHEGDKTLRVDLQEIAMNAPKRQNGRRARVEGRLVPFDGGYQVMASAVEFL